VDVDGIESGIQTRLDVFASMIRASPHNLLSPRALEELETRHFTEGMMFAASLPSGPRTLDVGSGGGLPGLIVSIARADLEVHLLESTGKKVDFLQAVVDALELDVTIHHGRAEDLARGALRGAFDIVTARAVAPLHRLVVLTRPFLRGGGTLHAIKGDRWSAELDEAEAVLARSGMIVRSVPEDEDEVGERPRVIVLERVGAPGEPTKN
jgi:16S rRNA (guanine527-N7)-methyltransferase